MLYLEEGFMATNIKTIKRLKLVRRIGLVGLVISSFGLIVVLILAFLPRDNSSFTIQIDNASESSDKMHFTMSPNLNQGGGEQEQTTSYLTATPLGNAATTEAVYIENWIESRAQSKEGLTGSQNYVVGEKNYAMMYTVYLTNTSKDKPQGIEYSVPLDEHVKPSNNANDPLEYLRVLVRTEVVDSNELPKNVYYGARIKRDPANPTAQTLNGDDLEPISSRKSTTVGEGEDRKAVYTADFSSNGNDGYCIPFEDEELGGNYLIKSVPLSIPAAQTLRLTFVSYFEGKDYDSDGPRPYDASLLLSLHFSATDSE